MNTFKFSSTHEAAEYGDFEELKRMHLAKFEWDEKTTWKAAQYGHLDCLQYAVENGCPMERENCLQIPILVAAEFGKLDCLRYLHSIGCTYRQDAGNVCTLAAHNGHLDCLKFAHSCGYPWDEETTRTQNIECLGYAIEHGCPYDVSNVVNYLSHRVFVIFDFDMHPWVRTFLFPLLDTSDLHPYNHYHLYTECKNKISLIYTQKQLTLEMLKHVLTIDVIQYCIFPYF